jgi:hypothetical protein
MVISLYVCEIPRNVDRADLEDLFKSMDGYQDIRLRPTSDGRKIGFIDFKEQQQAVFALDTLQGFKFSPDDKGLIIKISDNSKNVVGNKRKDSDKKGPNQKRYRDAPERDDRRPRNARYNRDEKSISRSRSRSRNRSKSRSERSRSRSLSYKDEKYKNQNNFSAQKNYGSSSSNLVDQNTQNSNPSNQQNSNANILDILSLFANANMPNISNPSTNKPYTLPENQNQPSSQNVLSNQLMTSLNPSQGQNPNDLSNLLESIQNLQALQMLTPLIGSNPQSQPIPSEKQSDNSNLYKSHSKDKGDRHHHAKNFSHPREHSRDNRDSREKYSSSRSSDSFSNNMYKFDDYFKNPFDQRKNATHIVYVEGLPNDASEREVSHIFRPFPGFKSVRLITREKNGQKSIICFADFEDISQSTICINTLQGYRFDKNDLVGLHFSYGVSKHKDRK